MRKDKNEKYVGAKTNGRKQKKNNSKKGAKGEGRQQQEEDEEDDEDEDESLSSGTPPMDQCASSGLGRAK